MLICHFRGWISLMSPTRKPRCLNHLTPPQRRQTLKGNKSHRLCLKSCSGGKGWTVESHPCEQMKSCLKFPSSSISGSRWTEKGSLTGDKVGRRPVPVWLHHLSQREPARLEKQSSNDTVRPRIWKRSRRIWTTGGWAGLRLRAEYKNGF